MSLHLQLCPGTYKYALRLIHLQLCPCRYSYALRLMHLQQCPCTYSHVPTQYPCTDMSLTDDPQYNGHISAVRRYSFAPQAVRVGFVADKVDWDRFFSEHFRFTLSVSFQQFLTFLIIQFTPPLYETIRHGQCMSTVHVNSACQQRMSTVHVNSTYQQCMSTVHVNSAYQQYMSTVHINSTYQ